jgi:hypothetical protein
MTRTVVIFAAVAAIGSPAAAADWQRDGLAWRLVLTHADVRELRADADAVARWVPDPTARTAVTAAAEVLDLIDEAGGENGVELSGVLGVPGAFVWPAVGRTPFVRLVAFQTEARQDLADEARVWKDLARRVGGRFAAGWADAGRFVLRANTDGTVSLAGGGAGAARFRLSRSAEGAVCLCHADGQDAVLVPVVGPAVRGAAARLTAAANGVGRWAIRFAPDGSARLVPAAAKPQADR